MELVDGPTLADRIADGPILLDESLHIAGQLADALEAAHEHGIIHRDLKPANIKLRPDGTVKVLDFGLAKAMERPSQNGAAVSASPTITTPAMTGVGVILGTAAYMSPEQAKGRVADKRSDIWAFGCVLYEMLSGRRAFEGEDISDTFAFILTRDPEWTALPTGTPAPIRRLLSRCLEKKPRKRLADIADARLDLEDATSASASAGDGSLASFDAMRGGTASRRVLPWTVAGVSSAAAVTLLVAWAPWRGAAPPSPHRLLVEVGADVTLLAEPGGATALSRDGRVLVFAAQATPAAPAQLYVRRLEDLQARVLAGTDGAFAPFFSPNGEWIAFFAGGKLKKVLVAGGAVVTLCDVMSARGGSWGEDGFITFTPDIAPGLTLLRVSDVGGNPEPLAALLDGEVTQRWPQILPGRNAVLYTSHNDARNFDEANLVVRPLSGEPKIVLRGGYSGRYLASGHLVFIREGTLLAAPFDIGRLQTTGPPVPAVEGVAAISRAGGAHFSISDEGTLVYVAGQGVREQRIHWMDRSGATGLLGRPTEAWANPQFAPDGRSLALEIGSDRPDVWIYDLERETFSRLTSHAEVDQKPIWSPDGRRIAFASQRAETLRSNLYWQRADGTEEAQRLTSGPNNQIPGSWHRTGMWLAFSEVVTGRSDLMLLPMEGDSSQLRPGMPTPLTRTSFNEIEPMFSPDGRWLAYASDESGRYEVYVRPFPSAPGRETISSGGGSFPTWSRTRPELFYRSADGHIMVSTYAADGGIFRAEKPRPVADTLVVQQGGARRYDLHPDGNRFAIASVLEEGSTDQHQVVLVFNFFEHLRRIAPVK
jgi:eukaryotic-like serine/threonine-protein kinase